MKISITLDLSVEEVMVLHQHFKKDQSVSDPTPEKPVRLVRVADIEMNHTNPFWELRLGKIGSVIDEREGMWDVQFTTDPFPCKDVDPQRFTPISA